MTRSLVRPLTRSLVRSLVRGPSLDADAAAYIAALVSSGATVTSVQSSAIDTFIRAEKAGERWDLIKRLYLPIWELAAPNAICMRSLTSGTMVNSPTQDAGVIRSNGTTSYFDTGISPGGAGCLLNSTTVAALVWDDTHTALASSDRYSGAATSDAGTRIFLGATGSGNHGIIGPNSGSALTASADGLFRGIMLASRTAADSRYVGFRSGAGWNVIGSDTAASQGLNSTRNMFFLCQNQDGTPGSFLRPQMGLGAGMFGLGMTPTQADEWTANTKKLWETCATLTLPMP